MILESIYDIVCSTWEHYCDVQHKSQLNIKWLHNRNYKSIPSLEAVSMIRHLDGKKYIQL